MILLLPDLDCLEPIEFLGTAIYCIPYLLDIVGCGVDDKFTSIVD